MNEELKYEKFNIGTKVYGSLKLGEKILESWLITDLAFKPWENWKSLDDSKKQDIPFNRNEVARIALGYGE